MKKLYFFLVTLCLILTNSVFSQVATWMHGDVVGNQFGVYGTQGIPDPANKPGGRQGGVCFTDAGNNFWLFGGSGLSAIDDGQLNDLWKYSSLTNQWTWVNGGNVSKSPGIYGIKGVPDASNRPGARQDAVSWVDASGFLWLMGGYGYSSTGLGFLNDLWKYNPTLNQWTWVSGDNIHNQNGVYSGLAKPGSRYGAVSWTDGTGNLWLMGGNGYASVGIGSLNDLWKYNPALNAWTWVSGSNVPNQPGVYGTQGVAASTNIPGSRSDAVNWFANNYLWLMGGDGYTESSAGVLNDLWKYDPLSNQWTWVSGDNTPNMLGVYGTKGVGAASNNPGSRRNAVCWKVMYGALWLMGGEGFAAGAPGWMNDIWKFDLTTNLWTWMHGDDVPYQYGVYGTQGVPAASNKVGSRYDIVGWCDAANNLWFLGGKGNDVTTGGLLNDLWRISNLPATTNNLYYRDNDNDGYGDPTNSVLVIGTPQPGYVSNNTDCNDNNAAVHPGATELCNGIDDNCNGQIDEGGGSITYYRDADADGYGDPAVTSQACAQPTGYVTNNTDCNDANPNVHPGATELCNGIDDNCNGQIDEGCGTGTTYYRDADSDSFGDPNVSLQSTTPPPGYVTNNTDCDDTKSGVHPGAIEVCNGIDDNCNGQIDEGVKTTFYLDADGDGYGTAATSTQACSAPAGYVSNNTDCDDAKAGVHPGATELCNGIDDNCNGQIDEGCNTTVTYYRDADGDGFGNPNVTIQATTQPPGYVTNNTDCDDTKASVHPGATEICNGIDDNCNGQIDEGVATNTFYKDGDGDGYGNPNMSTQACTAPSGYVTNNGDCNDANANIHPGAAELCNGVDDDCDGLIDEGVKLTFYRDADRDGYGNPSVSIQACIMAPAGYVSNNKDCDDTKASVHPGANEVCNGIDDDCDGQIDEGVRSTFYRDADGDGYGTAATTTQACTAPTGYVSNNTDCNDANASVYPGALEVCNNNIDDDCDGQIDEGCNTTTNQICAFDEDFYGSLNTTCVFGTQITSKQMMYAAVDAQPNDSVSFGSKPNKKYFTLRLADVQNNSIFNMLPGQGKSNALKGYATYSKPSTWKNVPLKTSGRIDNELLSQTMTLFFNIYISPTLKNISLDKRIVIRKLYFCSVPGSQETVSFHIKKSIIKCLKSQYGANGATVNNLYVLANDLLGDIKLKDKDCKVKKKDVMKAMENINEMFGRCVLYYGYGSKDDGDEDDDSPDDNDDGDDDDDDDDDGHGHGHGDHDRIIGNHIFQKTDAINEKKVVLTLLVSASPNPFQDRVRFTITSPVSGDARIVILDVNGKQIGEIKQKVFAKITTTVNYTFNRRRQGMLFYKVIVNNVSATGKMMQMD
jgi:putative metal-binding protein/galactose oxidase-like protein